MKLINPNELAANLEMEFGDDNNEITKQWLKIIDKDIDDCQDYSKIVNHKLFMIGETLVRESKQELSQKNAIERIRKIMQE